MVHSRGIKSIHWFVVGMGTTLGGVHHLIVFCFVAHLLTNFPQSYGKNLKYAKKSNSFNSFCSFNAIFFGFSKIIA